MTSVHSWRDTRVFEKMSRSVSELGHEVHLVVPVENSLDIDNSHGVIIHPIKMEKNRPMRMLNTVRRVLDIARDLDGDIYQFHDPEFLTRARKFQDMVGKPVVYDSHEDYRLQAKYKFYIPRRFRSSVGGIVGAIEDNVVRGLAGVVCATPSIAERFRYHMNCVVVQNFPLISEFVFPEGMAHRRSRSHCGYIGGLSEARGIAQMIMGLSEAGPDIHMSIGGSWSPTKLRSKCVSMAGWSQVKELGYLTRGQIRDLFSEISFGLVLLHPVESYLTAYPVKMFEYMAAGLPVIASDFPLWREIVETTGCGCMADPLEPLSIGLAMRKLVDNPDAASDMGERGREAVLKKYNWDVELKKLLAFYNKLVAN